MNKQHTAANIHQSLNLKSTFYHWNHVVVVVGLGCWEEGAKSKKKNQEFVNTLFAYIYLLVRIKFYF